MCKPPFDVLWYKRNNCNSSVYKLEWINLPFPIRQKTHKGIWAHSFHVVAWLELISLFCVAIACIGWSKTVQVVVSEASSDVYREERGEKSRLKLNEEEAEKRIKQSS